ncbi:hypothetical protein ABZ642_44545 [Streptomyces sp. NPDC007157]|uniref:hypothetical protein n=1 Tax=Streptomyces sp. NPDC007157 TaxID=3154681 RepID=UPI0033E40821
MPPERPRRRRRTGVLIATAAVLGVVAGTCVGYLVQADREPTALPPLSQPSVAQAKGAGPEPLSAAQDRKAKVDGDLRKLLLSRPRGARKGLYTVGNDGWLDASAYAETSRSPDAAFRDLVGDKEFRRAAVTEWRESGDFDVEIRLIQYRQEEKGTEAADAADSAYYYAEAADDDSTDGWPVPGTGDGMAYVHNKPDTSYGVSVYSAEAHAWRGDIALEVWISDTKPIPKAKVLDLAKRQMERL